MPHIESLRFMVYSAAVLNPSYRDERRFSLKETKFLHRRHPLSDLPVYKKKSPPEHIFLYSNDAATFTERIAQVLSDLTPALAEVSMKFILQDGPRAFGKLYPTNVIKVMQRAKAEA